MLFSELKITSKLLRAMPSLRVSLSERSYTITIGQSLAATIRSEIEALQTLHRPLAVVADTSVVAAQKHFFKEAFADLPLLELPSGETTKSFKYLEQVCEFLAQKRIDRQGALIAVGGGVLGDLAGFAAASYLRGIDFYQVPTTLLSMVDSSVGGKTGINLHAGKNLAGAFWQPKAVYIDTALLNTLPKREFSAGMAEVIKYGMLHDFSLFETLEGFSKPLHPEHPDLPEIIRRCCAIKAEIVGDDERELKASGGRALLNLGHTFAHAIENVAGYGEYLHGEAVGIGLVLAARLSERIGKLDKLAVERVESLVKAYDLPSALRSPLSLESLFAAMRRDKKVRSGKLRFVAMESLGKAITVDAVDESTVSELWLGAGASR